MRQITTGGSPPAVPCLLRLRGIPVLPAVPACVLCLLSCLLSCLLCLPACLLCLECRGSCWLGCSGSSAAAERSMRGPCQSAEASAHPVTPLNFCRLALTMCPPATHPALLCPILPPCYAAEVVVAAGDLRGDRDAMDLLCFCLALPLWSAAELQEFYAVGAGAPHGFCLCLHGHVRARACGEFASSSSMLGLRRLAASLIMHCCLPACLPACPICLGIPLPAGPVRRASGCWHAAPPSAAGKGEPARQHTILDCQPVLPGWTARLRCRQPSAACRPCRHQHRTLAPTPPHPPARACSAGWPEAPAAAGAPDAV